MNRLKAFEMWYYKRILKISWTEEVRNFGCSGTCGKRVGTLSNNQEKKIRISGHVLRGPKYELLLLIIMYERIEGKR